MKKFFFIDFIQFLYEKISGKYNYSKKTRLKFFVLKNRKKILPTPNQRCLHRRKCLLHNIFEYIYFRKIQIKYRSVETARVV